ncbi:MAG: GNAT family N-acetyltransferase [Actinomycetota bacterium]
MNRDKADFSSMGYEGSLPDGTRILFRPIRPDDKDRIRRGFELLSPESRYRRFFSSIDHLSEDDLRYLTEVDFQDHFAWLAVLPDQPSVPGAGVARWIRLADEPDVAEGAVTVIDSFQHQGIGSTLLWLAARSAIERGIRAFRVWVQGENAPILRMLHDAGVVPRKWEAGIAEVDIPLPSSADVFPRTPAPMVLRATAAGELSGQRGGVTEQGTTIVEGPRAES